MSRNNLSCLTSDVLGRALPVRNVSLGWQLCPVIMSQQRRQSRQLELKALLTSCSARHASGLASLSGGCSTSLQLWQVCRVLAWLTSGQVSKQFSNDEEVQAEYDHLKEHLEAYMALSGPQVPAVRGTKQNRTPSRHIAQLTQAASRALGRDVPGLPPLSKTARGARFQKGGERTASPRDEIGAYQSKASWAEEGIEKGLSEIGAMRELSSENVVPVDRRWTMARDPERKLE